MVGLFSGPRIVLGLIVAIGLGLAVLLIGGSSGRRPSVKGILADPSNPIQPEIELTPDTPNAERLRALWHMHQTGLIDDDEYAELRAALLRGDGDR